MTTAEQIPREVEEALDRIEQKLDALPTNQRVVVLFIAIYFLAFVGLFIWLT